MSLHFVLDENVRGGGLWQAIQQHNALGGFPLDVVRVGDPPDLPLGTPDPDLLLWAEREDESSSATMSALCPATSPITCEPAGTHRGLF